MSPSGKFKTWAFKTILWDNPVLHVSELMGMEGLTKSLLGDQSLGDSERVGGRWYG